MHDALADVAAANALLEPFLEHPVKARELPAVGALQRAVVSIVDALITGSPLPSRRSTRWQRASLSSRC